MAMPYPDFETEEMERETEEFMMYIERQIEKLPTCEVLDDPTAPPDQQPTQQPAAQQPTAEGASGGDVTMSSPEHPSTSAGDTSADDRMVTSPTSSPEVLIVPGPSSGVRPAAPSSSDSSTGTKPPGATSPKRKAEDDVQEPSGKMETNADSGRPAAKGAKLSGSGKQRREDVEMLIHNLSRHRSRPFSPSRRERYMQMPREMVRELMEELRYRDMYFSRRISRRRGDRRDRRQDEVSDEDSDSELPRPMYNDPSMGGAKFVVSDRQQLLRLLIIGSPTQVKTRSGEVDPFQNSDYNSGAIHRMLQAGNGTEVVEIVRDVSVKGRSSKQDGIIYALARCCRCDDIPTKRAAYAAIKDICRTPTQLFLLVNNIERLDEKTTGWGRGLRRAVCEWYNSNMNNPHRLAMQITKYNNRHGWCHRDIFRLAHIKPADDVIGFIVRYAVKGMQEAEKYYLEDGYQGQEKLEKVHKYLKAVEEAKQCMDRDRTLELIREFDLVREQLRTEMLNEPQIWSVMLPGMPLTALMRNINKMTNLNLFEDPERLQLVRQKLLNREALKKARVHPFKLLLAHHVYKQGHGEKGALSWTPNRVILDTLEQAFYQSFGLVEPTNKRILIALDISGSMSSRFQDSPIECREAATLMAMVTVKSEPHCDIVGFHTKLVPLNMFKNPAKKLEDLVYETHMLGFGATDCSKPMTWARHKQKEYDAFIIFTDSETNTHRTPPWLALQKYRDKMNIPNAKLIVVGLSACHFSIAKPDDINMLDVVGFDTDTPDIIREFLMGSLE
nr:hypothetical protein BaRGS_025406 [Batillaria attramentaria]